MLEKGFISLPSLLNTSSTISVHCRKVLSKWDAFYKFARLIDSDLEFWVKLGQTILSRKNGLLSVEIQKKLESFLAVAKFMDYIYI